jgi:hypothetical protein
MTPEQEWALVKVRLAEQFGWTFDYIEKLTQAELQIIFAVKTATSKYTEEENKKRSRRGKGL